ncbi:MAG: hypothetical protein ACREFR_12090, partial [Limisphaerales bacterium]
MTPTTLGNEFLQKTYVPAAMMVSLLSVWMLVALFFYLNRYTKREYFTIWTAAWLFYALWLTLNLQTVRATGSLTSLAISNKTGNHLEFAQVLFILKQCCIAVSGVFLLWGSLRFLGIVVRQLLLGLFMAFLVVWTIVSPQALSENHLGVELPVFLLIGLSSMFGGVCFFRLRKKMPFVGAGMLSMGFMLWGIYLSSYPFAEMYRDLTGAAFLSAAVLQLFIAVSMVVLVLEEARYNADR